ncbi:MAG: hypothetical protein IJ766_00155 [Clostridia bacterium]|nr:hypothetical protein [Clostridia bacterium]
MINRSERRRRRLKKIQQRVRLLTNTSRTRTVLNLPEQHGYLANNNEVNARMGAGTPRKTNTRKSCAAYRHHGGYGSATKYKPHDQRQIDALKHSNEEA